MAYVLGFWYADGHMRHAKSYRIYFTSKDKEHLINIRGALGSNSPVLSSEKKDFPTLVVRSKRLYSDLLSLGGLTKKSTRIRFPKIHDSYLPDFIRGFFDGDGSVHYIVYKATKNDKFYTEIRSNFTSGSLIFLEQLREILSAKISLPHRVICQYGPHQFKLGYGQKATAKLLGFMYYPGHTISLDRKSIYLQRLSRFFPRGSET